MKHLKKTRLNLLLSALLINAPVAKALTVDELAAQFEAYKKEQAEALSKISQENAKLKQENQELKAKAEVIQQQVETTNAAVETVSETALSKVGKWFENTSIGGYGEVHYNNRSKENDDHQQEVDFHRFVLFLGHEFTDKLRFASEVELEHSNTENHGEIELEQAYLQYDITDEFATKGGLFLMPVGIMNETHEPDTFYGVERNEVETAIIPTTWWEAGIGSAYKFGNGITVEGAVTSGLELEDNFEIREARRNVSEQPAEDPIIAARVKYTGVPGLELSASILHQPDMAQGNNVPVGSGTLYETHAIYSHAIGPGAFTGKALYSRWDINVNSAVDQAAESQYGWYLEPSYRMPTSFGDVGVYGRYQKVDYYAGGVKNYDIWEGGANWWLHENVVLKANYIYKQDTLTANADERGFDIGLGYHF